MYFQCAPESEDDDGHDRIPTDEDIVFIVADNYNLAAMRNSPLRSQGVLIDGRSNIDDGVAVVNSDKVTFSPVIHQFDRDSELKGIIRKRTQVLTKKWMQQRNK